MPREGTGPDFIEALARGLDVIRAFEPGRPAMSLADGGRGDRPGPPDRAADPAHAGASWATCARRTGSSTLTPRVLELGMAYVRSLGLWDVARPHMERLVAPTDESCSIAQLDGSDIVYVARVAVPKIVALAVRSAPGSRPCRRRWARCCWPRSRPDELDRVLAEPSRSGHRRRAGSRTGPSGTAKLREVRARGWALTDEQLARGHPLGGRAAAGRHGRVIAAMNVNAHAAETSVEHADRGTTCRCCCRPRATISADWAACQAAPQVPSRSPLHQSPGRRDAA